MRTDLTANFIAAMQAAGRSPRQLAVFHFASGDLFLSDQIIGISDGLDNDYESTIISWGELLDMAGGDPTKLDASEIRQVTLTLWNGGTSPFSDNFLSENPENIIVDIYQWFDGLLEIDKALIDTFVIQDPINYAENNFRLDLDLVSLSMRYDNPVGDVITLDDYPTAPTDSVGRSIPIIIGSAGQVQTIPIQARGTATLNGSILKDTMIISVNENLSSLGFSPSNSLIKINEETISYSTRTDSTFFVSQRGIRSIASEHISQSQISERRLAYITAVGKGPVSSISNILVAGFPNEVDVLIDTTSDPATLFFEEQPFSKSFADSPSFLAAQFDVVETDNTAVQPHLAFDPESAQTAEIIQPNNNLLSVSRATSLDDLGEIVKAFIIVEHYESSPFDNDIASVSIDGIGQIGTLARPNQNEETQIEGEVDIDHEHTHQIGREHTHPFTDPTLETVDPGHNHGDSNFEALYSEGLVSSSGDVGQPHEVIGNNIASDNYAFFSDAGSARWNFLTTKNFGGNVISIRLGLQYRNILSSSIVVTVRFRDSSGNVLATLQTGSASVTTAKQTAFISVSKTWPQISDGYFTADSTNGTGSIRLYTVWIETEYQTEENTTDVSVGTDVSGSNANTAPDGINDVDPLGAEVVPLSGLSSEVTTRTIANVFDITSNVNFDWAWFQNKKIQIEFTGGNDPQSVYILNVFFDIEYRKREVVFSDDVTCDCVGIIDDSSGTITGTPNQLITRPDHVRKYILTDRGGLPDTFIDSTNFDAAGTRFDSLGYHFDGVISGSDTVRELEKKLASQCRSRFFWNAGFAKIKLRENIAALSPVRDLSANNFKLRSFSAERQRVTDLINKIDLTYNKDHVLDSFKSISQGSDAVSISKNGILENRTLFNFDLVSSSTMGDSLRDFYLENLANASTFYTFETYLDNFDIEKEDAVTLTTNFGKLRKAIAVIRSANRMFGDGNINKINLFKVVAEVIKYVLIQQDLTDEIMLSDNINIDFGFNPILADLLSISETIDFGIDMGLADTVTISDIILLVAEFAETVSDSITISEDISCNISVSLSDLITITDSILVRDVFSFGKGGYGEEEFGNPTLIIDLLAESATITDIIGLFIGSALTDTIALSESIIFSAGFGGNDISDGFGNTNYGS